MGWVSIREDAEDRLNAEQNEIRSTGINFCYSVPTVKSEADETELSGAATRGNQILGASDDEAERHPRDPE